MRAHLLAVRRQDPHVSNAELIVAARKWAAGRQRPAGVTKGLSLKHSNVLLGPATESKVVDEVSAAAGSRSDTAADDPLRRGDRLDDQEVAAGEAAPDFTGRAKELARRRTSEVPSATVRPLPPLERRRGFAG